MLTGIHKTLLIQSIDTVHRSVPAHIPFQIAAARTVPASRSAADQIPAPPPTQSPSSHSTPATTALNFLDDVHCIIRALSVVFWECRPEKLHFRRTFTPALHHYLFHPRRSQSQELSTSIQPQPPQILQHSNRNNLCGVTNASYQKTLFNKHFGIMMRERHKN